MELTQLARKLRLQDARAALIINSSAGYLAQLGESSAAISLEIESGVKYDFGQLFVINQAQLERDVAKFLNATEYDAVIWICYPKGSSRVGTDPNRDILWELMKSFDVRPVTQVAVDSTWSAMRFRPPGRVGS